MDRPAYRAEMEDASEDETSGPVPIWGKIIGLPENSKSYQDGREEEGATGMVIIGLLGYGGWFGWVGWPSKSSWNGGGCKSWEWLLFVHMLQADLPKHR